MKVYNSRENQIAARAIQFFQVTNNLGSICIGIILVKYVSPILIGQYEMVLMLSILLGHFIFQGFVQSFLSKIKVQDELMKKKQIFSFFVLISLLFIAIIGVIFIFKNDLSSALFEVSELPWLNQYLIYTALIFPSYVLVYVLMLDRHHRLLIFYSILFFLVKVSVFFVPLFSGYSLDVCVQYLMYSGILFYVLTIVWLAFYWTPSLNLTFVRSLFWIALPLIGYGIVGILPQYVDAWIVNWFYQESEVFAIFRYGAKELPFVGALTAGVASVALPLLTENEESGKKFLIRETERLIRLLFPVCIVLILAAPYLFQWVYSDTFRFSGYLFSLLIVTIIPRLIFAQTLVMYLKKGGVLLWVSIGELLINIALSLLFVKILGLLGILLATVLAFIFEKCVLILWLQRLKIKLKTYLPVKLLTVFFLVCLITWLVSFLINRPEII